MPRILHRDNGICHLCGRPGADTADHLIPVKEGGTDDDTNLAAAHHTAWPNCNRRRGTLTVDEARLRIARYLGDDPRRTASRNPSRQW